jgi:hypothetical protein
MRICTVNGCNKPLECKGMCAMHYMRDVRANNPAMYEKQRKRDLDALRQRKYGISSATYARAFQAQKGRCAICKSSQTSKKGWHVDHDHETGQFRGILCHRCNIGLGLFADSPKLLARAARYIIKHTSKSLQGELEPRSN